MSRFVQLHLLTSYPPANLNRDDLGRPKTAVMGGAPRLRISSQSLKRAWRTSDLFGEALKDHVGTRTKAMGVEAYRVMVDNGLPHKKAVDWAGQIAGVFGKCKSLSKSEKEGLKKLDDDERKKTELEEVEIEQLAHFSPAEQADVLALAKKVAESQEAPSPDDLKLLRTKHSAADIALFGRMLAASPAYNTEAAAQVAHAISVHKIVIEDDFFTAVDDLNKGDEDMGAGHMGETEFAAGLFYLYVCVDKQLLTDNLGGNAELANKTLAALIECAATVAPTGKQNSFASRARASYGLVECGDQQPRSLSVAFLKPVYGNDLLAKTIDALEDTRAKMEKIYGECSAQHKAMNAATGEGTLQELINCAIEG